MLFQVVGADQLMILVTGTLRKLAGPRARLRGAVDLQVSDAVPAHWFGHAGPQGLFSFHARRPK